jgi:hypothetical protein
MRFTIFYQVVLLLLTAPLSIAGDEKASFKMDEDCNCWRWRRFDNIAVNTGDRVTLTGKADQDDLARLDYVEFIKR